MILKSDYTFFSFRVLVLDMVQNYAPVIWGGGGFPNLGMPFWGVPIIRSKYGILVSILGSAYFGNLPFRSLHCMTLFGRAFSEAGGLI